MRTEYVCHACLLIDTGDARIVTDPWFHDSAYCDQWFLFPKPVDTSLLASATAVVVSHAHEDHLHGPSLRRLPKDAKVFYPYSWYGGTREWLESLGYGEVTEAVTHRTYAVTPKTSVTMIANHTDSIVVVESGGEVLVNVNDALHAHHPNVIDAFVRSIKSRWPKIDYVFCGFGGANYFPNAIHFPGKADLEVGRVREQYFVHNFCRIVEGLAPVWAVPFAADFALLEAEHRWINELRFPRSRIGAYFAEHFPRAAGASRIRDLYPGDRLNAKGVEELSPYRGQLRDGALAHLIDEQYAAEIERKRAIAPIDGDSAAALAREIEGNAGDRARLFDRATLDRLHFCVRVTDVAEQPCYNVSFAAGAPAVRRAEAPEEGAALVLTTSSRLLRHAFASAWGGDALVIGYGCDIDLASEDAVARKLDTACIALLTRNPRMSRHFFREPARGAKFLATNPLTLQWGVKRFLHPSDRDTNPTYHSDWILRTKCEICQMCDLPLLDAGFSSRL